MMMMMMMMKMTYMGMFVCLLMAGNRPSGIVIAQEDPSFADMIVHGEGDPRLGDQQGKKMIALPFAQPLPLPLWHNPITNIDQQVLLYFGLYSGLTNQRITFLNAAFFSRMAGRLLVFHSRLKMFVGFY